MISLKNLFYQQDCFTLDILYNQPRNHARLHDSTF